MSYFVFYCAVADQLPRLWKREIFFLLSFTCNYVVSVRRGVLFLLVLGMGCVILVWRSLGLPYNYFTFIFILTKKNSIAFNPNILNGSSVLFKSTAVAEA